MRVRVAGRRPRRRVLRKKAANKAKKSMAASVQKASVVETSYVPVNLLTNTMKTRSFSLGQFPRAFEIAKQYKYYRASAVEWRYTPSFNTFQDQVGTVNDVTAPVIYTAMNRTQDLFVPATKATQLQYMCTMGPKGKDFKKPFSIKYVPNWCSPGLIATSVNPTTGALSGLASMGQRKQTGFLACPTSRDGLWRQPGIGNTLVDPITDDYVSATTSFKSNSIWPASVVYNGHYDYIRQDSSFSLPDQRVIGLIECIVHWEFKGPNGTFIVPLDEPIKEEPPLETTEVPAPTGEELVA